ncbi:hypothetical protein [uncultured Cyclobacterium sp.]|uniref:hypothetical protein n=1 Tax=uncultured Cyclobacterium sp. TaxID=453820 RepID=UPI0030EF78E7
MAIVWNNEVLLANGINKIKEIIDNKESKAISLKENKPIFLRMPLLDWFPKNPKPNKIEQMAVAGDILPGLLFEKRSSTKILSMEKNIHPRYSLNVIMPIKIKIKAVSLERIKNPFRFFLRGIKRMPDRRKINAVLNFIVAPLGVKLSNS